MCDDPVDDPGLWGVALLEGGLAEGLPHVHDGHADLAAFLGAEPGEELVQARLGAVLAAEPDRASPLQVADHDAVAVPLADGDLVDADDPRRGATRPAELLPHVLLVQLLDGVPVEVQFLGDRLDGALPAPPPDIEGEPPGVERVVRRPVEPFALHASAPAAVDPSYREVEEDPPVATSDVADAAWSLVVEGAMSSAADSADRFFRGEIGGKPLRGPIFRRGGGQKGVPAPSDFCHPSFFRRRRSVMTTAQGSPKTPRTSAIGTKPGNL